MVRFAGHSRASSLFETTIVYILFNLSNHMTLNRTIYSFVLKHLTILGFRRFYKIQKILSNNGFLTCRQLRLISRQKEQGVNFNATDETKPILHVSICCILYAYEIIKVKLLCKHFGCNPAMIENSMKDLTRLN